MKKEHELVGKGIQELYFIFFLLSMLDLRILDERHLTCESRTKSEQF